VVERAVERTGYADFWELRSRGVLPVETTNYVPIILAMTIMEKNAAEYGLSGIALNPPLEYDTVEITAPTNLALVADLTEAPVSELLALNPAVLKNVAPEGFGVHVPKGAGNQLMATLQLIPPEHRIAWRIHRVASGETLASIGKQYGMTATAIASANKLDKADAVEGDRLVIPAGLRAEAPPKHAGTANGPAKVASTHRRSSVRRASTTSKSKRPAPARTAHQGPAILTTTASR